jgi:hypothetical protein
MVNERHRVDGSMPWTRMTSRSSEVEVASRMRVVDPRAADLEVVVVLRIDGRDGLGLPHLGEMLDGSRGRLARVVPALEGGDHDRVAQFRHIRELNQQEPPIAAR